MALYQTLCDLDSVPCLLESIRERCPSGKWVSVAEELASKATLALEQLAVFFESESDQVYKEPEELRKLKLLVRHLEILMDNDDLQKLFMDKLDDPEIVEILLPFVDPSAGNNYAIQWASYYGHVAVVNLLLQDKRVDPSAVFDAAIWMASLNGHVAVVERLLQDPRMGPSDNNIAIRCASAGGHLELVKRLLQNPRVGPSTVDYFNSIQFASEYDHVEIVELLKAHRGHLDGVE